MVRDCAPGRCSFLCVSSMLRKPQPPQVVQGSRLLSRRASRHHCKHDRLEALRNRVPGSDLYRGLGWLQASTRQLSNSAMAATPAMLRLMSDLKAIKQEPPEGCSASPVSDENLFVWNATVFGPDDTPWEGGIFSLRITFSESYPDKPPRVRFTSEMFHPNVYQDGTICLDIIQDQWSPCHNVCTLLTSVQSLLTDPNCQSPANPEAAHIYNNDRTGYNKRVRRIAQKSIEQ